jgi:histone H3
MARTKQTARRHDSYATASSRARVPGQVVRQTQQIRSKTTSAGKGGNVGGGNNGNNGPTEEKPVDREVRELQNTTHLLIPRAPFLRVVREITQNISPSFRFRAGAIEDLRHAAEAYLIGVFQDANEIADHAGRKGVTTSDVKLVRKIRGDVLKMGK